MQLLQNLSRKRKKLLSGQENDDGNWFLLGNNSFQKVSIHQNVNDLVFVNVIVALEIELKCLTTFLSLNSDHYNFVMVSLPKKINSFLIFSSSKFL